MARLVTLCQKIAVQLVTGTCTRRPSLAPSGCPLHLVSFCWCCSCWRVFFFMIIFKSLFFSFTTVVSLEKQRFISYSESLTDRAWGEPVPGSRPPQPHTRPGRPRGGCWPEQPSQISSGLCVSVSRPHPAHPRLAHPPRPAAPRLLPDVSLGHSVPSAMCWEPWLDYLAWGWGWPRPLLPSDSLPELI